MDGARVRTGGQRAVYQRHVAVILARQCRFQRAAVARVSQAFLRQRGKLFQRHARKRAVLLRRQRPRHLRQAVVSAGL